MEKYAVAAAELEASRARIRALLVPDAATGQIEADSFPRSAVMRFLFDPRSRRLAMTGLSMLLMFAGRNAMGRAGLLSRFVQSVLSVANPARR